VRLLVFISGLSRKQASMKKGSFGVNTLQDNSPLYIVQRIKGAVLLCSTRFDDPPCSWVTIQKGDFWLLA
jgi:hypothetical protein